ncbi:MAG: LPXTG cell wall anchor domain-containing protein, partial [Phycisphaerae bacterium]|nr:LPXTG cell wall anchor domain-containing protein [Phycisphaerae bacterium]
VVAKSYCGDFVGGEGALMLPLAGIAGILGSTWLARRRRFHT